MRKRADTREHIADFEPVSAITKDNVAVQIDNVVYYQVTDPRAFVYGAADPIGAIGALCATVIRNQVGGMDLDDTLTSREAINALLKAELDEVSDRYGLRVTRVEIKNIVPPQDILDAMEKQMRAGRQRREAILTAKGEKQSAIRRPRARSRRLSSRRKRRRKRPFRKPRGVPERNCFRPRPKPRPS